MSDPAQPSAPRSSPPSQDLPCLESRPGGCDLLPPRPAPRVVENPVLVKTPPPAPADVRPPAPTTDAPVPATPSLGVLPLLGWACALLTVLWVAAVSAPFLAQALTLHGPRLAVALVLAALPALLAAALAGFVLWRIRSVPDIPQVREDAFPDPSALCDWLRGAYLATFPASARYADENGFVDSGDKKTRTLLVACLDRLQGNTPGRYADSTGWLDDFKQFQAFQDARAADLVRRAARLVGVKTAASPWKIVDMLAVLFQSSLMIVRLGRLYNRRIGPRHAFRLACRWLVNLYVSGTAGDAARDVADWGVASELISATWSPVAKIAGKLAEGSANAFLIWRLGTRAIAAFRPLVPRP